MISIRREIDVLKLLNHENLIKLHCQFENVRNIHIVMDLAQGMNLREYLEKRTETKFVEDEARHIFRQVLNGVRFLHANGISHRDIKLENVMIVSQKNLLLENSCNNLLNDISFEGLGYESDGATLQRGLEQKLVHRKNTIKHNTDVKLVDFGFAIQSWDDSNDLKLICGTPNYMAPELLNKQRYNGKKADIWALGVMLYYMLTGIYPFSGNFFFVKFDRQM